MVIFIKELLLRHRPARLLPYIVAGLRIAYPGLFCPDVVISGEVGMRRACDILKTYGHDDRTLYPVGKVLHVEIAEGPV